MSRTQLTLGALLLAQVVLIALLRTSLLGGAGASAPRPLLPALTGATVTRLELSGAKPDEKVTLLHEGAGWVVENANNFPADSKKVTDLLANLRTLTVRRAVVTSDRYHEAFKVTEQAHEGRLRAWTAPGDTPQIDLLLGSSPNYRSTNVRVSGEDPVYEVQGLSAHDVGAGADAWIDKTLADVPAAQVTGIAIANAKGAFALEKRDGSWVVGSPVGHGPALDQEQVESLIRTATGLRIAAAAPATGPETGLDDPAATVTLRYSSAPATPPTEGAAATDAAATAPPAAPPTSEELTVQIGSVVPGDDTQRYVTRAGSGHAGTIWDSSVKRLLEQDLAGLAQHAAAAPPS